MIRATKRHLSLLLGSGAGLILALFALFSPVVAVAEDCTGTCWHRPDYTGTKCADSSPDDGYEDSEVGCTSSFLGYCSTQCDYDNFAALYQEVSPDGSVLTQVELLHTGSLEAGDNTLVANGTSAKLTRACTGAIIARHYSADRVDQLKRATAVIEV